ncbi:hypothetical protein F7725_009990 [Dissostichus mawsoni]|uniref:Uncharacterized protein n=1 Tax=Dissostichus mawsoni TaxID=36200 RepID=A0A7J5XMA3_DISMA|nr:hypothetical protein F7725_009990 [Dissostichus mawsoni]
MLLWEDGDLRRSAAARCWLMVLTGGDGRSEPTHAWSFLFVPLNPDPRSSSTVEVTGLVGHNVTLPCSYDAQTHGVLSFCWGRGMVPKSKCSRTILSLDGTVLTMKSSRFQLRGRVSGGDVSLTILDAQWSDAGVYGCRVEIPGWFNDLKLNTHLLMEEAPEEQPVTPDWRPTVGVSQELLTTFAASTENEEVPVLALDVIGIASTEEKLKAFLEGEHWQSGSSFLLRYRRRLLPKRKLQDVNFSTAENIYECRGAGGPYPQIDRDKESKMFSSGRSILSLYCNLLFCLLLGCVSAESIIATVGEDVTLICNYDAKYYGKLPACWGRGAIPNRGCDKEVIKADGTTVTSRLSERYLLKSDIGEGDVSLTIRQVEEGDSGMYGCRVEIPGWFNDHKHQLTLTVVAVRPNAPKVEIREVKSRTVTVHWSPVFDGGKPIESYLIDLYIIELSSRQTTEVYNPKLTQLTWTELRPAKAYDLRMFAINSVGRSDTSNVLTFTTKEAAPEGPPLDMQLEPLSSYTIKVTISYREYDPAGRQFKRWQHLSVPATRELESVVLSNLKPSARYGVIIQAKTDAGIGPASNAPLCSTLDEVPPDPPLLDYIKTVIDFSPNQTDATIIEMNPSTFNIRMFAKNSLATSGASNVLTITTAEGGHQRGDVLSTISTDTHAAASVDKSQGGHLAAIAVPVVLVLLVVGMVTTWKLLREYSEQCKLNPSERNKTEKGNLNMCLTNGALRYRGAEPLQELSHLLIVSPPQGRVSQPAGFPSICPVNLLIVLIKDEEEEEIRYLCGALRQLPASESVTNGDHRGIPELVSQRGQHGK